MSLDKKVSTTAEISNLDKSIATQVDISLDAYESHLMNLAVHKFFKYEEKLLSKSQ